MTGKQTQPGKKKTTTDLLMHHTQDHDYPAPTVCQQQQHPQLPHLMQLCAQASALLLGTG